MALVELSRHTGDERYLALAAAMVERRGHGRLAPQRFGPQYLQDHAPVREATEPVGHAVRQLYLAAGVTDVYLETGDASLLEAMEELWRRTFAEKTYVTGAHGSRHRDEAFGDPYELPPDRAYGETCAAIASFMWNWRLLLATGRRALRRRDGARALQRDRRLDLARRLPLHLLQPAAPARGPRRGERGRAVRAPAVVHAARAARRTSRGSSRRCTGTSRRATTDGIQLHLLTAGRVESDGRGAHAVVDGLPVGRARGDRRRGRRERVDAVAADPGVVRGRDESTASRWRPAPTKATCGCAARGPAARRSCSSCRCRCACSPRTRASTPSAAAWRSRAGRSSTASSRPTTPASRSRTCASTPPRRPRRPARNRELGVPVTLGGPATVAAGAPDALYPAQRPQRAAPAPARSPRSPTSAGPTAGPNAMRVWIPTA